MSAVIVFDRVSKSYDGQALAVRELSLSIETGQFVALVGGSGSGKTTTLKLINGLALPDRGTVRVGGRQIDPDNPAHFRRGIGYVFQEVGLFPHMTVAENIGVTPRLMGLPEEEIDERVAGLLDLMGLPGDYAVRLPAALSGGQRQRIGVARALAARPALMLMDEPLGALDPVTRESLGGQYRKIHDAIGLTTVMVTHDMAEALILADRILVMEEGRLVADASPADLFASTDPAVAGLMAAPKRQAERIAALGQGGRADG